MWIHIPKECFPFAPDTEDLSSLSSLPELPPELCATSNEKSIQPRTWRRLWKKAMWIRLLSGMTLPPSTRVLGVAWWRLSLRGSPVSQWRLPASESTPQTNGGSGLTLTGFFATWSQELSSWRTAQGSLFQTGWERFSGPWPTSASVSNGQCVERARSERATTEQDSSSLLPTPTSSRYGTNVGGGAGRVGKVRYSLEQMAKRGMLPGHPKGSLNLEWTEQAMGLPMGWSGTAFSATESFQPREEQRSGTCGSE